MSSSNLITFELSEQRTVFVGGIPADASEKILFDYFSTFGAVENLKVISKKQAILSDTAFCFLSFEDASSARDVLAKESHVLFSRLITCRPFMQGNSLQSKAADENRRKVFVKYIPKDMTEDEFKNFFSNFGAVDHAYLVRYSMDGNLISTVGYVVFQSPKIAALVIKSKNIKYQKRKLRVEPYIRDNGKLPVTKTHLANPTKVKQPEKSLKQFNMNVNVSKRTEFHPDLEHNLEPYFSTKPTTILYFRQRNSLMVHQKRSITQNIPDFGSRFPQESASENDGQNNFRFNLLICPLARVSQAAVSPMDERTEPSALHFTTNLIYSRLPCLGIEATTKPKVTSQSTRRRNTGMKSQGQSFDPEPLLKGSAFNKARY